MQIRVVGDSFSRVFFFLTFFFFLFVREVRFRFRSRGRERREKRERERFAFFCRDGRTVRFSEDIFIRGFDTML